MKCWFKKLFCRNKKQNKANCKNETKNIENISESNENKKYWKY
ncbi:hypothetical protein [Spiroplasma endosymbiont of Glossina fuscipes fuscipes]